MDRICENSLLVFVSCRTTSMVIPVFPVCKHPLLSPISNIDPQCFRLKKGSRITIGKSTEITIWHNTTFSCTQCPKLFAPLFIQITSPHFFYTRQTPLSSSSRPVARDPRSNTERRIRIHPRKCRLLLVIPDTM